MIDTTALDHLQLEQLEAIYWLRVPSEACGLILPTPHKGNTVVELPNRSMKPHTSFVMTSQDIRLELDQWFTDNPDRLNEVIFWHTHPSGDPKPSKVDRANRVSGTRNVIVTVPDHDSPISLYWF